MWELISADDYSFYKCFCCCPNYYAHNVVVFNCPFHFVTPGTCCYIVSGHPTCLDLTSEMIPIIKTYEWQCMECKACVKCMKPHDEVGGQSGINFMLV
jgi:hypothetical protein